MTPLLENVDALRVADIIQYAPNFRFAADYARSLCVYWSRVKGVLHSYSTETNWPCYGDYSASTLSTYWSRQLVSYYQEAAPVHFIMNWDVPVTQLNGYEGPYSAWRTGLYPLAETVS